MLLSFSANSAIRGSAPAKRTQIWRIVILTLILAASSNGAEPSSCVLDLPVYDEIGNRLAFKVTRVTTREDSKVNLLSVRPGEIRRSGDQQLMVDRSLLRRVIVVTLEGNSRAKVTQPVFIMQCPQRVSFRSGVSEAYGDVAFQSLTGRIAGCRIAGDWWIRVSDMFGPLSGPTPLETRVEKDGSFSLPGQMSGGRQLLVIGKNNIPLKVIGVNVTVGKSRDLGTLDLSGNCPP